MTYVPPVREVSSLVARLLMFLAVVLVVGEFSLFAASVPSFAVVAALAVALLAYAVLAWRTYGDPGPGYFSCLSCKRYRVEAPSNARAT